MDPLGPMIIRMRNAPGAVIEPSQQTMDPLGPMIIRMRNAPGAVTEPSQKTMDPPGPMIIRMRMVQLDTLVTEMFRHEAQQLIDIVIWMSSHHLATFTTLSRHAVRRMPL